MAKIADRCENFSDADLVDPILIEIPVYAIFTRLSRLLEVKR
eukprot:gene12741-520_t